MAWKPHATVAAIVQREDKFLMVEERIDGDIVFNQPAGHLEDNESLSDAVIREVMEETGWEFQPLGIVGIYRWQHPHQGHTHLRTTFFGSVANHNPALTLDHPILSADWYTRSQLTDSALRSPMVLRCIDDFLAGSHHPLELLHDVL